MHDSEFDTTRGIHHLLKHGTDFVSRSEAKGLLANFDRSCEVILDSRGVERVGQDAPGEDWDKLLGETAAVTARLDRLMHHAHLLNCGPRSWRTRPQKSLQETTQNAG